MTQIAKKEKTEIQRSQPDDILAVALSNGASPEQLQKLWELKLQVEANEAKKAYHKAMSDFKTNAPQIVKDKKVAYSTAKGNTAYSHASLYNATNSINQELSKHGLSASWKVAQNGVVSVTCRITHEMGHFEETTLSAPADDTGSKNKIQAIGSAISYLERYTLLALTGLATKDQDDDAKSFDVETITDKQEAQIRDYLTALEVDEAKFCKFLQIQSLEDMPKPMLAKALASLKAKEKSIRGGK